MLEHTPLFSLEKIGLFLHDFKFGEAEKKDLYNRLYSSIVHNDTNDQNSLVELTGQHYEELSKKYRESHANF